MFCASDMFLSFFYKRMSVGTATLFNVVFVERQNNVLISHIERQRCLMKKFI